MALGDSINFASIGIINGLAYPCTNVLVWGIWCQVLNGDAVSFSIRHRIAAARGMTTGGELATGRHSSRHKLVCGRSLRIGTMMQPCASAAKFRSGGSILHSGLRAMLPLGAPPPRIVIGRPPSRSSEPRMLSGGLA